MRRIKILHLLTSLAPGGAETNLLALLRHFDHERFEHAIGFWGRGGVLEAEFSRIGAQLVRVSPKPLSLKGLLALPAFLQPIRSFAPDIIHSHLDLPNVPGLAAKFLLHSKLVLHLHGFGIVPRAQLAGGHSYSHYMWNAISHLYRYCDRAIAICSFQKVFLAQLGFRAEQVVLISNGIDDGDYPLATTPTGDEYRFVVVGRFFPQKDHALLIRAFAEVSVQVPGARLTLVGDGHLRKAIEIQVADFALSSKVEFLGVRRDIPAILAASHCFVLNSLSELHPITILEAMRAGLPVIASAVGGVPDTVVDGQTGLLTRPGDQAALVKALLHLARNPALGVAMGEAGRRRVIERFSNRESAARIEALYVDMLKSRV